MDEAPDADRIWDCVRASANMSVGCAGEAQLRIETVDEMQTAVDGMGSEVLF